MSPEVTHPPVLHETYFPRGSGCTYTGPNDDDPCNAGPVLHVVAGDTELHLPSSLPACLDHVYFAIRAARTRAFWQAHPYGPACAAEGENLIRAGYCTPPQPTRCASCGHWSSEHGTSGCAADDEAAMGGCDCTETP